MLPIFIRIVWQIFSSLSLLMYARRATAVRESIESILSTAATTTPSRIHCGFVNTADLRCTKEELINVTQIGSLRFPNVLIIGASKTGTTALSALLASHPDVRMSGIGGQAAADGAFETDFLLPPLVFSTYIFHIGDPGMKLSRWSTSYFGGYVETPNGPRIIVDKVPAYSHHPMVPYLSKMVFTQPKPKFIFTVRDPVVADMSLYNMRNWAGRLKMGYDEFALPRMKIFQRWWKCREQTFNRLLMGNVHSNQADYVTIRDLYNPEVFSWETTQMIEEEIYEKCDGMGYNSKSPRLMFSLYMDYYQERLYAINLRRWVQIYGEDSVLCFTSADFRVHQAKIKKLVATHLGIDPELFVTNNNSKFIDSSSTTTVTSADALASDFNLTYAKTLAYSLQVKQTKGWLDWALGEVRKALESVTTQEDNDYIRRMCRRDYDAMPG